jgi:hypothetical protein
MRILAIALGMAAASIPIATISQAPAYAYEVRNPADCEKFLFAGVDRSAYSQCIADLGPIIGDPAPPIHHLVDPQQEPRIWNICKLGAEAPKCAG